ncbi:MAG: hypothetical protein K9K86_08015 [Pseudomonadales bacterium]|nr:hypothetical protein [Pseudomonadales bacterium]
MTELNMSLDDFKSILTDLFGQPLNDKAEVAAQDFWQNVSAISEGVSQGSIAINVDVLSLARAFPEYKTYQVWKGLAILVFVLALPIFIFSWQIALGILVASAVCHAVGNMQRRVTGQRFVSDIQAAITAGDVSKGIANLCAQYIAGNVQLASSLGQAHWPQRPSDVLTGKRSLIQ